MLFVRDRVLMFLLISFDACRAKIPCKNETFSSNFSILCKGQRLGFDKMYHKKCHIKYRERLMKLREKKSTTQFSHCIMIIQRIKTSRM